MKPPNPEGIASRGGHPHRHDQLHQTFLELEIFFPGIPEIFTQQVYFIDGRFFHGQPNTERGIQGLQLYNLYIQGTCRVSQGHEVFLSGAKGILDISGLHVTYK